MFKAKVIALYVLLTVLAVLTALNLVGEGEEAARRSSGRVRAQHAIDGFRAIQERDQQRRENVAESLSSGRLAGYMETLREFRVQLIALESNVYESYPSSDDHQEEMARSLLRRKHIRESHKAMVTRFGSSMAKSVFAMLPSTGGIRSETEFAKEIEEQLIDCGAVGRNQCLHRFTYLPLLEEMTKREEAGDARYLTVLVDDRGTAWANSDNSKWSEKVTFGEEQVLIRLGRDAPAHGLVQLGDLFYFGTTSPFVGEDGRYNGGVMVCQELDQAGYASMMAKALGTEVVLTLGDQLIVASRQDQALFKFVDALVTAIPAEDRRQSVSVSVQESDFEGVAFYLAEKALPRISPEKGIFAPSAGDGVKAVLAVDISESLRDLGRVQTLVPLVGIAVCFIGILFLLLAIWHYRRPFVKIDQGIHEIISGDQAYEFEFDFNEELPDSIGQNLNMMVAILSGRPLPDDIADARSQNWAESMLIGNGFEEDGKNGGAGGEYPMTPSKSSASGARTRSSEELRKEPAEKYYRRIYTEFLAIRESLGQGNEGITYVRFVDKVVKSERALRESLDARAVRFNVENKAGNAVLTPVHLS